MSSVQTELLRMVERMPAFPTSVQKVLRLSADINCAPAKLVSVIEHDPVLTLKILRVSNSAYFGLSTQINSINHAVVYLGINTVKHTALAIAAIGMLPKRNRAGLDMDSVLQHSLSTAVITRTLGARIGGAAVEPGNCFVAGLLHDIGKVVFGHFKPKAYTKVLQLVQGEEMTLVEAEQEIIGANHADLGGLLVEKWGLSPVLVKAIRDHHTSVGGVDPLTDSLNVANACAHLLYPSEKALPSRVEPPAAALKRFGDDIQTIASGMSSIGGELLEARTYIT